MIGRHCPSPLTLVEKDGTRPQKDRAEPVQKQGKGRGNVPCGQEVLVDSRRQIDYPTNKIPDNQLNCTVHTTRIPQRGIMDN